ncbi:MAG: GNAT family N-acetyltransferase [Phycisphaerales bacterium]|nr:GNAT family N-acetyltransferase [Phycisphaerales bacterium]
MNVGPVTLELPGGRARLEPFGPAHAEGFLAAARGPEVFRWLPTPPPRTLEESRRFIQDALTMAAGGTQFPFAIVDRESGAVAGSTRYLDIQPAHRGIEIGWTIVGVPWQRTSINTECKYLLMRHAFETLGAVRVMFKTDARNLRSRRAIARIGGVYEGALRKARILHDGYIRDTACFSVIDDEWPAAKQRLQGMLRETRPEGA